MVKDLGPCQILFGTVGAEEDLGRTFGGVTLTIEETKAEVKFDQTGDVAIDRVHMGDNVTVLANLAEVAVDTWSLMGGSTYTLDGVKAKNVIIPPIGTSDRDIAENLLLKRIIDGDVSADANDWFTFRCAAATVKGDLAFNASGQRAVPVLFNCYQYEEIDGSFTDIMIVGDETAT